MRLVDLIKGIHGATDEGEGNTVGSDTLYRINNGHARHSTEVTREQFALVMLMKLAKISYWDLQMINDVFVDLDRDGSGTLTMADIRNNAAKQMIEGGAGGAGGGAGGFGESMQERHEELQKKRKSRLKKMQRRRSSRGRSKF